MTTVSTTPSPTGTPMNVWLDEQPLPVERPTLFSALEAARAAAAARQRVIIEVEWDGQRVDDDLLTSPPDTPSGRKDLRFTSTDAAALVSTTMFEMADLVKSLTPTQQDAAEALQSGRMTEAFEFLTQVIDIWDMVRRGVQQGPALLNKPLAEITAADGSGATVTLESAVANLSADLLQVRSALEGEDWSTLADLLLGEMHAQAGRWFAILRSLGETFRSA